MSNLEKNLFELHKNIIKLGRSNNAFEPRETAPSKTDRAFEPEETRDDKYANLSPGDDVFNQEEQI